MWARRRCATRRSRARSQGRCRRVVQRELALAGEQRRPPAGARGQLDDPAADRQPVQPSTGRGRSPRATRRRGSRRGHSGPGAGTSRRTRSRVLRSRRPCRPSRPERRGKRAGASRATASRPRGASAAVAAVPRPARRAALRQGLAEPEAQELVVAGLARRSRGRAAPSPRGRPGPTGVRRPAPQARERRTERHRAGGPAHATGTGVQLPGGAMSTNAAGSMISARSSIPSMTRGPGRLK